MGMGSPSRCGTQVENLCYGEPGWLGSRDVARQDAVPSAKATLGVALGRPKAAGARMARQP